MTDFADAQPPPRSLDDFVGFKPRRPDIYCVYVHTNQRQAEATLHGNAAPLSPGKLAAIKQARGGEDLQQYCWCCVSLLCLTVGLMSARFVCMQW